MLRRRGLAVKKDGKWYVSICCGVCNGIDEVCNPIEYKLHHSDHKDFDFIHENTMKNVPIWTSVILIEEEDFVGGCGHTGYPTYTTYAKLPKSDPPTFMNINELDNLIDF
jgi:hypothetical protein